MRFTVTDTGHGVAPEVAHLLFKPFSPGDSSYARREQGAGLGLAVAKRVIEQAGGTIGFTASPAKARNSGSPCPVSGQSQARGRAAATEMEGEHPAPARHCRC